MEIKYLKLIKTIAEEGNISNSAEKLFLTQSALSHQLRDLEDRLGVRIFLRARNGWQLTDEGQELYKVAVNVLNEIDQGLSKVKGIKDGSRGRIKIKTECYSFYRGIPAFMQKMAILYPELDIDLMVEGFGDPFSKLLSNELDIAIVTCKPDDERLVVKELFEDEIFAVMNNEHYFAKKPHLEAKDFENIDLIIHSYPMESVTVNLHFLAPNNVIPTKVMAIPLTEVALELVEANMGVMCIPRWSLDPFSCHAL
ncbi:MAG: LysR family transcriptional regulator [Cyclobacteriaceae bacterium]